MIKVKIRLTDSQIIELYRLAYITGYKDKVRLYYIITIRISSLKCTFQDGINCLQLQNAVQKARKVYKNIQHIVSNSLN